jgi:hypothetical protein
VLACATDADGFHRGRKGRIRRGSK